MAISRVAPLRAFTAAKPCRAAVRAHALCQVAPILSAPLFEQCPCLSFPPVRQMTSPRGIRVWESSRSPIGRHP